MSNSWRITFDYFILCAFLPCMFVAYTLWFLSRHSEVMRVRQTTMVLVNGVSYAFMIAVVITQDLVLLQGGGDFPCMLLMIASLQAIPLSSFLGLVNTWLLVYSFHPALRKRHFERGPRLWKWILARPRNYFTAAACGWVLMCIPFAVFYTQLARWRPPLQRSLPGEFGVCWMAHEYYFYTPITALLVCIIAASRPYVRDISDYYNLGAEARIATYMGVWTLCYHALNILAQAGVWDRAKWDRDVIPLNWMVLVTPVALTVKVGTTVYLSRTGKGSTLLALTRNQAALQHAAHKARIVAHIAEGGSQHHPSDSSFLTDTSQLGLSSSSKDPDDKDPGDIELGNYEGSGGGSGSHAPHLAAILADATLREMMLLHARRALCPENIVFISRMVELRELEHAGPQLAELLRQLKEAQQQQRARSRAAMPIGHRSLPSQLPPPPSPPMQATSQPSCGAPAEVPMLSSAEQLVLVQRALPLLDSLRSDFVAAGSTYELNLSMDLRRSWIKQLAALESWAKQEAAAGAGSTETSPSAAAPLCPSPSTSSPPLSPLCSFLLTLDLVESEVLLLTETNLYHSFLDCAAYRAHARQVKHQARKADRERALLQHTGAATTVLLSPASSPELQPLSAPTSPTAVKTRRSSAAQANPASLGLDAPHAHAAAAPTTARMDDPPPNLPGQASLN